MKIKRTEQQQREHHIAALSRRLAFLEKRRDELGNANSYDLAEIAALRWVLEYLEKELL